MIRLEQGLIPADIYCQLRQLAGLSPKTLEAASMGLPHSLYMVYLCDGEQIIGMGRLVGDGALHCQICDIAVLPQYQGQGLGKRIMAALMERVLQLPASCYVNLIADGEAHRLYRQFGFADVGPKSVGMGLVIPHSS